MGGFSTIKPNMGGKNGNALPKSRHWTPTGELLQGQTLKGGRAIGELLCGGHSEAGRPKDGYKTPGEIARQTEEKVHF